MSHSRIFPETVAGGFSRKDGTIAFYSRVNALVDERSVVVDVGAGRAAWVHDDPVEYRRHLRDLMPRVGRLIAVDPDPVVHQHPRCHESAQMSDYVTIPLSDGCADVVISDHTLEHVDFPAEFVASVYRILKPGGWFCARTPNRWGYIGMATNMVPNRAHARILRSAQPSRREIDIFPTRYRMNTRSRLNSLFPADQWDVVIIPYNPDPAYFGNSLFGAKVFDVVASRVPESMSATWHVFARRLAV